MNGSWNSAIRRGALCCLVMPALLAGMVQGCGSASTQFSSRFPDNRDSDIALLQQRLAQAPTRAPLPIAVGVSRDPVGLYAYDLVSQAVIWRKVTPVSQVPLLAGDRVVYQHNGKVHGLDLQTGAERFALGTGDMQLVGADGYGANVVLTLSKGAGTAAKSVLLVMRGDSVTLRQTFEHRAGIPALVGDVALVPWGHQFLSGVDVGAGDELVRLRLTDAVVTAAQVYGPQVFVASPEGMTPLSPDLGRGMLRGGGFIGAPTVALPGEPAWARDVYGQPTPVQADSAVHRIALGYRPTPTGQLADDALYLVFYRFVMALQYPTLEVRWVHRHPFDLVGVSADEQGLQIADRQGQLGRLDGASGQYDSYAPAGVDTATILWPRLAAPQGTVPAQAPSQAVIREQLAAVAQDADARLVPMRRYAVDQLARMSGSEVTADLLAMCDAADLSPAVQDDACQALASRAHSRAPIVAALDRHYDYLAGTPSPAVGPLARAVATLNATEAYPLLVDHLADPHTPSSALVDLVNAIAVLNPKQASQPLSEFAYRYHADPGDEGVAQAVEASIAALFRLRGPIATETLIDLAESPLALSGVREQAREMLTALEEAARMRREKARHEEPQMAAKATASGGVQENDTGRLPERLTLALVERTLLPVRHGLRRCLAESRQNLFHGRMILVLEDNELSQVSVTPPDIQPCVEDLVRSQTFPKTLESGRQQISYMLQRK